MRPQLRLRRPSCSQGIHVQGPGLYLFRHWGSHTRTALPLVVPLRTRHPSSNRHITPPVCHTPLCLRPGSCSCPEPLVDALDGTGPTHANWTNSWDHLPCGTSTGTMTDARRFSFSPRRAFLRWDCVPRRSTCGARPPANAVQAKSGDWPKKVQPLPGPPIRRRHPPLEFASQHVLTLCWAPRSIRSASLLGLPRAVGSHNWVK
ncbi:hypothetical protein B0T11DRAFT_131547 [Plectosphaerella cucumerina]|uniref:Uncharacterized protein n=1 Tax=Plectosphaerella cucumerina TaxID=40658 RepID=A0A8K0T7P4_9PEZI|nr:hypothetical protein B0T11DRAFT_131547 [Plectosphaerella cucumerina]